MLIDTVDTITSRTHTDRVAPPAHPSQSPHLYDGQPLARGLLLGQLSHVVQVVEQRHHQVLHIMGMIT